MFQVVDLILGTVMTCIHTCYNKKTAGLTWLPWLLQALSQYDVVMETLYQRIWTLFIKQV